MKKNSILFLLILFFCSLHLRAQTVKILFDATKAEAAGNADWVIDADLHNLGYGTGPAVINGGNESNPQRIPSPAQSGINGATSETYWNGALSYWGIDCVNQNYTVETLPYNGQITYGNGSNLQDLSNYDVFIICEPNIVFSASEKTAILNFVQNGGGLFMVSDHDASDRNNDGMDSPHIWNDLLSNNTVQLNPFGMAFDYQSFSETSTNIPSLPSDSILHGAAGNVTEVQWSAGTTMTLNPLQNSTVRGVVYKTGSSFGNNNVMVAYARYGNGKVAAIGDSSPCDDGTGDSNDGLFFGYTQDANGNHRKLLMNITIWLATTNNTATPVAAFSGSPLTVCTGQATTFTDNSTGGVTGYSWNFGSGASPATSTTAGPHSVTYSTTGFKTILLTVTNAGGNNTATKTNYINVDNTSCLTSDVGALSLLSPALVNCPVLNSPMQVRVKNYGTVSLNFSTSPLSLVMQVTDPSLAISSFTKTINTGTLSASATMDITFDSTFDLITPGNYIFNANTSFSPDINSSNNAMPATTVTINPGFQSDQTVVSENMGTVTSTTTIASHESSNGFQNDILTMSGSADVRSTLPSSGYATASGGANVFFTNTAGKNFIIAGINTSSNNNLQLSFGIYKSVTTATGSDFQLQVSSDGIAFTDLTIPSLPSGTSWNYITVSGVIPSTSNLRIRFTQNSTTVQYRIDDLLLIERVTAPAISSPDPLTFCQGGSATLTCSAAVSYLWSNGLTTQNISVNTSGTYFVTATNASGCTASSSPVTITVKPVYNSTVNAVFCQGSSYTLSDGQVVSVAGSYITILHSIAGCDSVITTNLALTTIGCSVDLHLRVFIEGFYLGGGQMQATADPFIHPTLCDTITVQLREVVSPYNIAYTVKNTIDIYGYGDFIFPGAIQTRSYYVVVRHRNSLETWSASPVLFNNTLVNYTFSDASAKAYGSNLKNLADGNFALFSGDINQNGSIDSNDESAFELLTLSFMFGYQSVDLTGDWLTESSDYSLLENNLGKIVMRP